ncbi:fumarate hydratase [Lutispora sp.]|uniref:fumarate hydratase n=1 Tax=Lutispora sp. TaxID=2828727 RepID=UPI00356AC39B
MKQNGLICNKVKNTLIQAATCFRKDQKEAYNNAINKETNPRAKWVMENLLENAIAAELNKRPLCDDTGIPHLFLEIGKNKQVDGELLESIYKGVAEGLRELPGRPMAIKGDTVQRLDQSGGLDTDPGALMPAPIVIKPIVEEELRLHILMQGGGPEIRGKTYRVFHQHKLSVIIDEIVSWALQEAGKLGCTPCVPAIGIGRSHFEAASLMIEAMVHGDFSKQSELEREITLRVNESNVGPLGLGGQTTALATFLRVGPQRASGVRIVCLRLCCCMEPRVASVSL